MKHDVALVGILNVTPNSFSKDGIVEANAAVAQATALFADGATLVDVGAEATNPWAAPISPDEEWQRLEPVLGTLLAAHSTAISIDSHHPETITRAAKAFGASFIVNDVTGMNNPVMRDTVVRLGLRCIVSHLPARFGVDIHGAHQDATLDSAEIVLGELLERRNQLVQAGLTDDTIILDPGIGFGKTMRLNRELLEFAKLVHAAGFANKVMIGYSRKRFLGEHRFEIEPNLAVARIAIAAGADYLRVHDVAAHYKLLQIL